MTIVTMRRIMVMVLKMVNGKESEDNGWLYDGEGNNVIMGVVTEDSRMVCTCNVGGNVDISDDDGTDSDLVDNNGSFNNSDIDNDGAEAISSHDGTGREDNEDSEGSAGSEVGGDDNSSDIDGDIDMILIILLIKAKILVVLKINND